MRPLRKTAVREVVRPGACKCANVVITVFEIILGADTDVDQPVRELARIGPRREPPAPRLVRELPDRLRNGPPPPGRHILGNRRHTFLGRRRLDVDVQIGKLRIDESVGTAIRVVRTLQSIKNQLVPVPTIHPRRLRNPLPARVRDIDIGPGPLVGRERHHAGDPVLDVARVGRRRARQQDPADPSDRRPPPTLTHVPPAMLPTPDERSHLSCFRCTAGCPTG